MGWKSYWRVTCDQCSKKGPLADRSHESERNAVRAGWLAWEGFYGSFHACPECRRNLSSELSASLAGSNEVRGKLTTN